MSEVGAEQAPGYWAAGVPTRAELRAHLVTTRIAGEVATPREDNLRSYRRIADREPYALFGLEPEGAWTYDDVLGLLARRCGVSADPRHLEGQDTIDPDRTMDALDEVADRVGIAARRRERVLFATGHPTGLLALHQALARALGDAGCEVMCPGAGVRFADRSSSRAEGQVRYVGGVAVAARVGDLVHTHSARPMRVVLRQLAKSGGPRPDLVVADHGWAGAAGQDGLDVIGFADCNDPALFIGEAEGRLRTVVPLDDNVQPRFYDPLALYLASRAGL